MTTSMRVWTVIRGERGEGGTVLGVRKMLPEAKDLAQLDANARAPFRLYRPLQWKRDGASDCTAWLSNGVDYYECQRWTVPSTMTRRARGRSAAATKDGG